MPLPRADSNRRADQAADQTGDFAAKQNTVDHAPGRQAEAAERPDSLPSLTPPQQPDEIGRLGGYRILAELGRGGMGVVYKAEDPNLKRLVALKVMLPAVAADAASRQRFLREAQAMAAVRHDHVGAIFQVGEDNGVPFLAMEFLQGMPLDRWLKNGRRPAPPQVLRIGREIAAGLAAAHERGLIHRDIKPGNVWLDSSQKGRVKILDFGLARGGSDDLHLTRSGAILGTPAYMAPEQAAGAKADARSDLFSLGCVLYKLCTGATPFDGDNIMALLVALATQTPKPVRELNPDVPEALAELVMRLLEKDPAKRPQSAREVIQALQAIGRIVAQRPAGGSNAAVTMAPPTVTAMEAPPALMKPVHRRKGLPVAPRFAGRKRWPWVVAIAAAGFLTAAIVAVVVVIIRDRNGDKVAEVKVPPGGRVEVVDEGKQASVSAGTPPLDDAWLKQHG